MRMQIDECLLLRCVHSVRDLSYSVCAFEHVRIACSLTEFDFQYMLFTFGLISYLMGCYFILFIFFTV